MFHVNTETGVTGPCRAEKGACPFGTPEQHFATEAEATAHFERMMTDQTLVSHSKPAPMPNAVEAKHEALQQAVREAFTEEGQAKFEAWEAAAPLGSSQRALYRHVLAEAAKMRVASMDMEAIRRALKGSGFAGVLVRPGASTELERDPVIPDWSTLDENATFSQGGTVRDLVDYDERLAKFLAKGDSATEEEVEGAVPAMSAYGAMQYGVPPRGREQPFSYLITWKDWTPISKAGHEYSRRIAKKLMDHPNASRYVFERAAEKVDAEMAVTHPNAPLDFQEDYLAQRRSKLNPDLWPHYRNKWMESNRVALYMAAYDPDDTHRLAAFDQLMISGLDGFKKQDRLWLAQNLSKLPGSEVTTRTLAASLDSWARGHADEDERNKLLELLPAKPEPETRRGLFRRN